MHEPVVDDDVSAAQQLEAAHGDEPGIARSGADQRDGPSGAARASAPCRRALALPGARLDPRSSSSRSLAASRPRSTMIRRTSGPSARRHASAVTDRPAARSSRRASAASVARVAYSAVR